MVPCPIETEIIKYFRIIDVDPVAVQFFKRAVLTLGKGMLALKIDKNRATLDQDVTDGEEPILVFMAELENEPRSEEERRALDQEFVDDDDWGGQNF
jgi:hypothetical protein